MTYPTLEVVYHVTHEGEGGLGRQLMAVLMSDETKGIVSTILAEPRTTSRWLAINVDTGELMDSSEGGVAGFSVKTAGQKKTCEPHEHAEASDQVSALALAEKLRTMPRCVVFCVACLATG
jgi:hypothetical protein